MTVPLLWHSTNQRKVFLDDLTRFIVCIAGRRWGKTYGASIWLHDQGITNVDAPVAWIAPIYKQAKIAYRYFLKIFGNFGTIIKRNESNLELRLIGDHLIQFRSGDNPQYIEGEGYKAIVLDESWNLLQKEELWYNSIRPTLVDHNGRGLFISRADFEETLLHKLYLKGLNPDFKNIISYNFKTQDNPLIPLSEIEELEQELPRNSFKQQILGEFLDAEGRAIPNIEECAVSLIEEFGRASLGPYFMGLDVAKHNDFTVIMVGRRGKIIYYQRFNKLSWPIQEKIIAGVSKRFCDPKIIIDSTGVGDPIFDHLLDVRLDVEGYQFTELSRKQLLELLILRMDQKLLQFPNEPQIIRELKAMRWDISKNRKAKLIVPEPEHDDCVMSLALCNWGMSGILSKRLNVKEDINLFGTSEAVQGMEDFV